MAVPWWFRLGSCAGTLLDDDDDDDEDGFVVAVLQHVIAVAVDEDGENIKIENDGPNRNAFTPSANPLGKLSDSSDDRELGEK